MTLEGQYPAWHPTKHTRIYEREGEGDCSCQSYQVSIFHHSSNIRHLFTGPNLQLCKKPSNLGLVCVEVVQELLPLQHLRGRRLKPLQETS